MPGSVGAVKVPVPGFGRWGEGAGAGLDDGVERAAGVGGEAVRFNVFVGDGDFFSGARCLQDGSDQRQMSWSVTLFECRTG